MRESQMRCERKPIDRFPYSKPLKSEVFGRIPLNEFSMFFLQKMLRLCFQTLEILIATYVGDTQFKRSNRFSESFCCRLQGGPRHQL